jgi:DNA-binding GntR family transcriptional regulator
LSSPEKNVADDAPRTRVDRVYQDLREAIIEGEHPPGAPLRHLELSNAYGVSLIPIREALRRLEVERLVESIPNKGARVAPISLDDMVDVYATRIVLEVEALRRAWPRIDAQLLRRVRRARAEMLKAVRTKGDRLYELHRQVHFSLYERSGSPWLMHLIEMLWSHTERYRRLAARLRTFVDLGHDLHGVVLDAIESDDLDGASQALRSDLERTQKVILEAHHQDAALG